MLNNGLQSDKSAPVEATMAPNFLPDPKVKSIKKRRVKDSSLEYFESLIDLPCIVSRDMLTDRHHLFPIGTSGNRKNPNWRHYTGVSLRRGKYPGDPLDLHTGGIEILGDERFMEKYNVNPYQRAFTRLVRWYSKKFNENGWRVALRVFAKWLFKTI